MTQTAVASTDTLADWPRRAVTELYRDGALYFGF
jgi:hypothetical protein